jgi:membrane protease YdiL (CAAX protease family)
MIIEMLPAYLICVPLLMLYMKKRAVPSEPHKEKFSFGKLVGAFLVAEAFMWFGNIVGNILSAVIALIPGFANNNVLSEVLDTSTMPQTILIVAVIAPILEEIVFRKILIDKLGRYGDKTAIVVSAMTFGLFHGNIIQFAYAFLVGLVLGYVYRRTGNVIYSIIIHILLNFNGTVLSQIVLEKSKFMEFAELLDGGAELTEDVIMQYAGGLGLYMIYALICFAMVIAGIVIFFINKKKLVLLDGEVKLEKGKRFNTIVVNLGAILFIVLWLAMMVYSFLA